jgi:aarF domain-containing kinase
MDLTRSVTESWGIKNPTVFASATLARPWKSGKALHIEQTTIQDIYESQVNAKDQVSKFLKDSQNLPKELIFVGRNLK